MAFNPVDAIQSISAKSSGDGVNVPICDSSTFLFKKASQMREVFEGKSKLPLYSRLSSPTQKALGEALAKMEGTETAIVTSSGMSAISSILFQYCLPELGSNEEGKEKKAPMILSHKDIYGGTKALLRDFLPRLGIETKIIDIHDQGALEENLSIESVKVIYVESMSNPMLKVPDFKIISKIAKRHQKKFIVDNTFSPLLFSPAQHGADVVVHSLTKYINGMSDAIAGVICCSEEDSSRLTDLDHGAIMVLGPTMDNFRAASILKNLKTLPLRMVKHCINAKYLAGKLSKLKEENPNSHFNVFYPGLNRKEEQRIKELKNSGFENGGMLLLDVLSEVNSDALMEYMQEKGIGFLAVSLGSARTLFCAPASTTHSEYSEDELKEMGLTRGFIRISVGLDQDISKTYKCLERCLREQNLVIP